MTRWYGLEAADEDLFATAPHVFRYSKRFAAPVERVWESLTSDESLAGWSATVSAVNWLSPRPFGIGTTREVVLAPGLARVRERYFRWDEGRRHSFAVYEANLPVFRRFAEDYVVEPVASRSTGVGDSTLFTWTVAIEPKGSFALPFKPLAPALKLSFGRMAADGERYFAGT
jgi:Polyketide cyclase / dehydrase and lipid transport